jgi:hypothetical protein
METFHETRHAGPVANYRIGIEKTNPLAVTCDVFPPREALRERSVHLEEKLWSAGLKCGRVRIGWKLRMRKLQSAAGRQVSPQSV